MWPYNRMLWLRGMENNDNDDGHDDDDGDDSDETCYV